MNSDFLFSTLGNGMTEEKINCGIIEITGKSSGEGT